MTTTAHPWMEPPRPALIPIRLHCRRCLTTELFCPRCGTGLLFTGPASHVHTNHLLRRDCINCGAPLGVVLDGYSADASSPEPCPSGLVAHPPEPEKLTMPEPAQRQQLSLPVVLTPEPAPPAATTANQQEQRRSSRRAMPLVIFFVPEPAQGVAEMARVVAPGGTVAAYAWDMEGGGFPYQLVNETLAAIGRPTPRPPSPAASRLEVLSDLWDTAGLSDIHTRSIEVERTFVDVDDLWTTLLGGPSAGQAIAAMNEQERSSFRELLGVRLQPDGGGPITLKGRAHAIRGTVPLT